MARTQKILNVFKKYKYGIALSGGGIKGFAHIGVLKALDEIGIKPEMVSGVSAGAIAGVFYADGYTPDEIFEIFADNKFFQLFNLTFPKYGLLKIAGLEKTLIKYLHARTFEELKIPLVVSATELDKGTLTYFTSGKLIHTIIASACIPVIFTPVKIEGKTYADGGIMENLPVAPLEPYCKRVIGVHLNPKREEHNFSNLIRIAERVFFLHSVKEVAKNAKRCHIFIEPPELKKFGMLDLSKGKEIYDIGYQYAKEYLKKLPPLQKSPSPIKKEKNNRPGEQE